MSPITITESATRKLNKILKDSAKPAIRFGVKGGGCSGFQYYLEFSDTNSFQNEFNEILDLDNGKLIIDGASIFYIIGTTIDWIEDLMGGRFAFNSPKSSGGCGCGNSVNFKL